MAGNGVLKYPNHKVPRQSGEYARIRVLKGPDQGAVFVIKQAHAVIGRGREAQIRIADRKASRSHGKLHYTAQGWKVEDLGSVNGILHRGEFVRDLTLASGDHFTLGESVLEFLVSRESNQVLAAPIVDDPDLEQKEVVLAQQKLKVRSMAEGVRLVPRRGSAKKSNTLLLVLGLLVAGGYSYPDEARSLLTESGLEFLADYLPASEKPVVRKAKAEKKEAPERALSSYLPAEVGPEVVKTSDQYYREGFRELRAGNHLRARALFELAIQVNPSHERARFHLKAAIHENDQEIKRLIDKGKQSISVGRVREARAYLNSAIRRTSRDDKDPRYNECIEALKVIESGGKL
jgi:pSer/pThr/pTyr-binding forkhead associated (FHA) protein